MVSLLFPAFNRLEFTRQSWAALMANTDWSLVSEFHVYDDGSTDGTREWLEKDFAYWFPCLESRFHATAFHSPMGVTLDWIAHNQQPLLAKIDNDTIMPPGWLNVAVDVMARHPDLEMLGLECMRDIAPTGGNTVHGYMPDTFVSGLFVARRSVFLRQFPREIKRYFGLEEFQMQRPKLKRGWIMPSLPVFLLDRLPMEPWAGLSREYVRQGWQREWSLSLQYKPDRSDMWSWWEPVKSEVTCK
jgi:cellulose synthase/poly-beta-1,6-N-acetylglucosamine synthase-like glycosyltransferase